MRTHRSRTHACLVAAAALAGCGGELIQPPPAPAAWAGSPAPAADPDAGSTAADAGSGAPDGGAAADAGPADPGGAADAGSPADAGAPAPQGPRFGSCPVFPPDHPLNRDVSGDPVDPNSDEYLAQMGASSLLLHPDFGAPEYGLPVATVPGTQPLVPMSFTYAAESDPGPYPFPLDVPIQGGSGATGDRHAIVVDGDGCALYETYDTYASGGGFRAGSGARFDLITGAPRPQGWTSATASGLPLFPALARPDEVIDQGEIRHALLFTAGLTAHCWVAPASHSSGTSSATYAPPMGLRVRLRASYDLSRFTGQSRVILEALRRYGMLVVDNSEPGGFWSVAGQQSARWDDVNLQQIKTVPASAFEVVKLGTVVGGP